MPTAKYFDKVPPFPDDVPLANLIHLSLSKLIQNDELESKRLFQACTESGFLVLDLRSSDEGDEMLKDAEKAFDLNEEVQELDLAELMKYRSNPPKSFFGYKPIGALKHGNGTVDSIAAYNISQDDILAVSPARPHPELIFAQRQFFQDFFHHAYGIICHILSHLDKHLSLKSGTLASLNPQDKPSGTSLRMLRCPPQAIGSHQTNLLGHTDLGSITMLFNVVGGLQILPNGYENVEANWRYIRPEPGCAIINIADAITHWTGGILKSNIHRVVTAPGRQAACTRHSIAYLLRPDATVSMRRLGGAVIPVPIEGEEETRCARDWEAMRAAQIMAGQSLIGKAVAVRDDTQKPDGLDTAASRSQISAH